MTHSWCDIRVWHSSPFTWSWASSELTLNVIDGRLHLFHNLPLPSRFLHRHQLVLLGDRGTRVWTTCLRSVCSSARAGVKPATSWSLVQRSTCDVTLSTISVHLSVLLNHMFSSRLSLPSHSVPAPLIRSSRFWHSINLVVCMYVCMYDYNNYSWVTQHTRRLARSMSPRPPDFGAAIHKAQSVNSADNTTQLQQS